MDCPDHHQLLELLEETVPGNETVSNHVATCTVCQQELDRLTDSQVLGSYRKLIREKSDTSRFLGPPLREGDLGSLNDLAIECQIGAGGMGVVFQGRDLQVGRRVAVKILSRRTGPESDARFARESKSLARLTHDHVVPLYSFDRTADGTPYLVMPLIEGPSLKDKIANGIIPVNESAELIRQVALGLYFYRAKIRRYIGSLSSPMEAAELRDQSVELYNQQYEVLKSRNETTIWARRSIALNRVLQGVSYAQAKEYDDAFRCYEVGISNFNEILDDNPAFVIIIADLAESEWYRCQTRWEMGKFDQPEDRAAFQRTIELFEKLVNMDPRQMQSRRRLTDVHRTVGLRYKSAGNFDAARKHLAAAVDAYRQTVGLRMYSVPNAPHIFRTLLRQIADEMEEMDFDSVAQEYRDEAETVMETPAL